MQDDDGGTEEVAPAPRPEAAAEPTERKPKGKRGEGLTGYVKTANKLATLKARKSGGVKKIPGQGKSKSKAKAKAKAKAEGGGKKKR